MQSDTNPNHVKRVLVTHLDEGAEYRHTIEFEWPVALCYELEIAGAGFSSSPNGNGPSLVNDGVRLLIYLADKSRPLLKMISKEVTPVSLKTEDQDLHIAIRNASVHCPGLPSSISLDQMAGLEAESR